MKYIHSRETLSIPEGGEFSPNFRQFVVLADWGLGVRWLDQRQLGGGGYGGFERKERKGGGARGRGESARWNFGNFHGLRVWEC